MKKNKREEDEEIRRAKANIRTGFIIAVIALTIFAALRALEHTQYPTQAM